MFLNIKIWSLPKLPTFASVFHGIRFKVRRLFVVMTDNFFPRLTRSRGFEDTGQFKSGVGI